MYPAKNLFAIDNLKYSRAFNLFIIVYYSTVYCSSNFTPSDNWFFLAIPLISDWLVSVPSGYDN